MFWGLELEPARKYSSTAEKNFHISMACLQPNKCSDDGYVSFMFCQNNKNFILCNLHKEKAVQVQLDLNFQAGDKITFQTMGAKNMVYLSGYVLDDEDDDTDENIIPEGLEEELLDDSDLNQTPNDLKRKKNRLQPGVANKVPRLQLEEEEEEDEEDSSDDEAEEEDVNASDSDGEDSAEEEQDAEETDSDDSSDEPETPVKISPPKMKHEQKQKQKQKMGTPQQKQLASPVAQTNGRTPNSGKKSKLQGTPITGKSPHTPAPGVSKRTLEGGVIVEDTKVGLGTPAKPGKMVSVYYTGRLKQNNKQFDACSQGSGFKFRLGKGEVIKGWDIGVSGMKIGGKRKITIPAPLAYGAKGSHPQIPPNAPLVFEVELKGVS